MSLIETALVEQIGEKREGLRSAARVGNLIRQTGGPPGTFEGVVMPAEPSVGRGEGNQYLACSGVIVRVDVELECPVAVFERRRKLSEFEVEGGDLGVGGALAPL